MHTSGEKGTLGAAVGCLLGTGTQSIPAVPLSRSRNRREQPRGEVSSLVKISCGGQHLTQHCYTLAPGSLVELKSPSIDLNSTTVAGSIGVYLLRISRTQKMRQCEHSASGAAEEPPQHPPDTLCASPPREPLAVASPRCRPVGGRKPPLAPLS